MLRFLGCLIILALSLFLSNTAGAETLILTTGEQVTGPIIQRTDTYVMIDLNGLPSTYYLGEIQTIDGQAVELTTPTPVAENQLPSNSDEVQSLINFVNQGIAASKAATNTAPAAAAPVASAPAAAAPVASAPAAAAPVASAPAAAAPPAVSPPAPQSPPTLQEFLQDMFSAIFSFIKKF